jgi:uncharacterized BrkB/YihY/UPF0761 family membrane protein
MTFKGHRIGPLVKKTAREVMDDNVLGLGAQTAYYSSSRSSRSSSSSRRC